MDEEPRWPKASGAWRTRARIAAVGPDARRAMAWPGGARTAVWVVPNLEYYEYRPARYDFRDQFARIAHPDTMQWGYRDYGNRVGVWRLAEAFSEYPVRITASTNLAILEHCPEIAALVRERGWEVMSHGLYNTRYLGRSSENEEREGYGLEAAICERALGTRPRGFLGPCVTNSPWTMDLIAEAGMTYHADWVHDDVPVTIATRSGRPLVSVPYNYDVNDGPALEGHFDADYLVRGCVAQFDRLHAEGGKVFCLALHTYLMGGPHTIGALRRILDHVCGAGGVWHATGGEIADVAIGALAGAAP